jgi:hypothetical protein
MGRRYKTDIRRPEPPQLREAVGMGLLSKRPEENEEHGEISLVGLDGLDGGAPDEMVYELDDWSERDRTLLRERLETLGVPHHWEDMSLGVAADDEAWVERIMDQVEDDLSLALDPDVTHVAYDLSEWDEPSRGLLMDVLEGEAVPYGIEGDELFVHDIDEQRVDEMIEALVNPGEEAAEAPAAGPEVMGELFVAADRRARDPADAVGTLALIAAVRAGGSSPAPYGMDEVWWEGVRAGADDVLALMDTALPDHDAVMAAAAALRELLRPYV